MASDPKTSAAGRDAALDALGALLDGGSLRVYNGSKPANADAALSGNTLLAQLPLGSPAFAAASGGSMASNTITSDLDANATGTATWASFVTSGGARVHDVTCGEAADTPDLELDDKDIQLGGIVACSGYTFVLPA